MASSRESEAPLATALGCLVLAAILGAIVGWPKEVTAWLGATAAFLFGMALILGAILLVVEYVGNAIPRLRNVRFADPDLRGITPARLRWLGGDVGRPIRQISKDARQGLRRNAMALWGARVLMPVTLLATVTSMSAAFWLDSAFAGIGVFFGSGFAGGYTVLKLKRLAQRLQLKRRQLSAPTATEAMADDARPPILMLRSFRDDEREVAQIDEGGFPITLEETLEERLSRHGPVVAIGRPGESLPPAGASRDYVADDWQGRVRQLVDDSSLIVVILDRTPGLLWEIEQIVGRGRHGRLLIVVPDEQVMELSRRWRDVRRAMAAARPELADERARVSMRDTLAVAFEASGRARRIVCRNRLRRSYRDAVKLGAWFLLSRSDAADS